MQAVEPGAAIRRCVQREGDFLVIDGQIYDLKQIRRILVVGAGKAGAPMAQALQGVLGDRVDAGLVIIKEGYAKAPDGDSIQPVLRRHGRRPRKITFLEAAHPLPDERGLLGSLRLRKLLEGVRADDLVICLLSGGGSALMVSPLPGLSLEDLQKLTSLLLASGVTINQINVIRKHLERLKGGGLARLASPATVATLALSDVVGSPMDAIASGPTTPDPTTYADALEILQSYGISEQTPPAILEHLKRGLRGEIPETPKPGEVAFERVQNVIIGDNQLAVQAALSQASDEGFATTLLTPRLQGEARQVGQAFAGLAGMVSQIGRPIPPPACLVAGGETTVTLTGGGLGGRNQEVALGAVEGLAGLSDTLLISLATDGGDGPTDAAGAVATGQTLERAHALGLKPKDFLKRNDSYTFFAALDDLIITGPTFTNVNDLVCVFVGKR
jgi:glycerate 2-kinase